MPGWENFKHHLRICLDGYWQNVQIASPWIFLHPIAMLKSLFYGSALVLIVLCFLLYTGIWGLLSVIWFAVRAVLWAISFGILWFIWLTQCTMAKRREAEFPARPVLHFKSFLHGSGSGMTGLEYEQYVAGRLRKEKYRHVEVTRGSGDFGADILAVDPWGNSISIQCKYYQGKVGVHAVQEIVAARQYYATERAMVITNSTFTPAAVRLAEQTGVELVEYYVN